MANKKREKPMSQPKKLYRTTIEIWSDFHPGDMTLERLGWEAEQGNAFCSIERTELITDEKQFPHTEFFD